MDNEREISERIPSNHALASNLDLQDENQNSNQPMQPNHRYSLRKHSQRSNRGNAAHPPSPSLVQLRSSPPHANHADQNKLLSPAMHITKPTLASIQHQSVQTRDNQPHLASTSLDPLKHSVYSFANPPDGTDMLTQFARANPLFADMSKDNRNNPLGEPHDNGGWNGIGGDKDSEGSTYVARGGVDGSRDDSESGGPQKAKEGTIQGDYNRTQNGNARSGSRFSLLNSEDNMDNEREISERIPSNHALASNLDLQDENQNSNQPMQPNHRYSLRKHSQRSNRGNAAHPPSPSLVQLRSSPPHANHADQNKLLSPAMHITKPTLASIQHQSVQTRDNQPHLTSTSLDPLKHSVYSFANPPDGTDMLTQFARANPLFADMSKDNRNNPLGEPHDNGGWNGIGGDKDSEGSTYVARGGVDGSRDDSESGGPQKAKEGTIQGDYNRTQNGNARSGSRFSLLNSEDNMDNEREISERIPSNHALASNLDLQDENQNSNQPMQPNHRYSLRKHSQRSNRGNAAHPPSPSLVQLRSSPPHANHADQNKLLSPAMHITKPTLASIQHQSVQTRDNQPHLASTSLDPLKHSVYSFANPPDGTDMLTQFARANPLFADMSKDNRNNPLGEPHDNGGWNGIGGDKDSEGSTYVARGGVDGSRDDSESGGSLAEETDMELELQAHTLRQ
ncbi:hypothetical protein WN944_007638 [Citrus x changshan-huyou]|uniref:Uncharacterized protein n=1 Tax=Citrus x changshan-huyou TaxID=2935761 RepID=A0AAP0MNX8_9ROSI